MKHKKITSVPAYSVEEVDYITCDLCKEKIESKTFAKEDVEISCIEGSNYPEGAWGTETTVDMCCKCFNEKLIPWLKSQGVVPNINDDWGW